MDIQGVGEIRYNYLRTVDEAVRNGVARAEAVDRYQDAAYLFHVHKNILTQAAKTGTLVDVAA